MPDVQWPGRVANITPQIRKRALAVAAWMYFQLYFLIPEMHPGSLYAAHKWPPLVNAAFVANDCAQEGFVPAIVTRIPSWLMVLQRMHGVDLRGQGKFSEARLPDLWKAYDDYLIRQRTQEERRLAKISKAPHQYRCAAEGCGIQVLHKSFLAKCGGQCLPDSKPHYCSQQCQERVSGTDLCSRALMGTRNSIGSSISTPARPASTTILLLKTTGILTGLMLKPTDPPTTLTKWI